MSENGNPPVAVEILESAPETAADGVERADAETPTPADAEANAAPAVEEKSAPVVGEPVTPAVGESAAPIVEEPANATAEQQVADGESAASEATPAADASEAKGKPSRSPRRARKTRRRRGARSEEFVAPTPEELEGLPSALARLAVENGTPIEGKVIGWNQGGFHVVVDGVTSFCPRSSMELGSPHEPARYLDQTYSFRILRVEEKGHRLILSRAAALREERKRHAQETRARLEVGSVLEGRIVALTDFGAFADLGGVEGLIHVSEISHGRVAKPSEVLEVGQTVPVKVIKLGTKSDRVSLSMKALEPDPWAVAAEKWKSGSKFEGKVLRKTEFGWFVELAPGIEGLLHVSQLEPGMKEDDPRLEPGQQIEGWVRELDRGRHRVSLSLRETPAGNPWEGVASRYAEGTAVTGTVEKLERFGAFILLEPGVTGLLPTSEMGLPRGASTARVYSVGKQVKLQVAQVDVRRKRISLTLEGKTLEGSRSDYQNYVKKTRRDTGLSTLAAAFERMRSES